MARKKPARPSKQSKPLDLDRVGVVPTRKQAAALIEVTEKALGNWANEEWFPADAVKTDSRGKRCNWNVIKILTARDRNGRSGSEPSERVKIQIEREKERLEQDRMRTARERREHEEELGNILDRAEYTLFVREHISVARDGMLALPKDLARLAEGQRLKKKMIEEGTKIVEKHLNRLAKALAKGPSE